MTPLSDKPAEAKPAATIILLRDGAAGMEVLMLEKAAGSHFAAGALVFPGGKVGKEDIALAGDEFDDPLAALKVAAVREMYEECGIMLARRPGAEREMTTAEVAAARAGHPDAAILDLAASLPLTLATDRLEFFAHWITPPTRPKRFDTHFFIAPAPAGQTLAAADGWEIVKADWRRPADILAEAEAGHVMLVLPTLMNLTKLTRWDRVEAAVAAARVSHVIPVSPELVETEEGTFRRIPEEADYGATLIPVENFRSA